MEKLIEKALLATKETKQIEFKSDFDVTSNQDWCELIKDIIAISNSGGGMILFGVADDGSLSEYNQEPLMQTDPAEITNKLSKYIGTQFSEFDILSRPRGNGNVAILSIEGSSIPIVFRKPGSYNVGGNQQKVAFKEGSVYFRHGAKSAPGNSDDLLKAFQKELNRVKKSWLQDIGRIVKAPPELEVLVVSKSTKDTAGGTAALIRLTTDKNAPIYGKIDFDITHPHRQKELVAKVNEQLPDDVLFNPYDVISIRCAHSIADHSEFQHNPKFGSPQYSQAFVDWIISSYKKDKKFFNDAREEYYIMKNM